MTRKIPRKTQHYFSTIIRHRSRMPSRRYSYCTISFLLVLVAAPAACRSMHYNTRPTATATATGYWLLLLLMSCACLRRRFAFVIVVLTAVLATYVRAYSYLNAYDDEQGQMNLAYLLSAPSEGTGRGRSGRRATPGARPGRKAWCPGRRRRTDRKAR